MSVQGIVEATDLDVNQAQLAKQREYDEPFVIENEDEEKVKIARKLLSEKGLGLVTGGRFHHITGGNDKGKAVRYLTELYRKKYSDIVTIGIGDSENDFAMLDAVEKGFLVERPDGTCASDGYRHGEGVGPVGWNRVVEELFQC